MYSKTLLLILILLATSSALAGTFTKTRNGCRGALILNAAETFPKHEFKKTTSFLSKRGFRSFGQSNVFVAPGFVVEVAQNGKPTFYFEHLMKQHIEKGLVLHFVKDWDVVAKRKVPTRDSDDYRDSFTMLVFMKGQWQLWRESLYGSSGIFTIKDMREIFSQKYEIISDDQIAQIVNTDIGELLVKAGFSTVPGTDGLYVRTNEAHPDKTFILVQDGKVQNIWIPLSGEVQERLLHGAMVTDIKTVDSTGFREPKLTIRDLNDTVFTVVRGDKIISGAAQH